MNYYELAKELKEAGFPQDKILFVFADYADDGHPSIQHRSQLKPNYGQTASPTLSELIDACGGYFSSLNRGIDYWFANGVKGVHGFNERGSTHKEAVARLWLALQDN